MLQTSINILKALPILSGFVRREVDKVLVCKHFPMLQLPHKQYATLLMPVNKGVKIRLANSLLASLSIVHLALLSGTDYSSSTFVMYALSRIYCMKRQPRPGRAAERQIQSWQPQCSLKNLTHLCRTPTCDVVSCFLSCHCVQLIVFHHGFIYCQLMILGGGVCRVRWWLVCQSRVTLRTLR